MPTLTPAPTTAARTATDPVQETIVPQSSSTPSSTPNEPSPSPVPDDGQTADADVLYVKASEDSDGNWTFHVTVFHPDTGWEDYANGWDVVLPDGTVLKPNPNSEFTRTLLHPHENEQPFTRSQSGIQIPVEITQVIVRAHDLVDGFGGQEVIVNLNESAGNGFEVTRTR